MQEIVNSIKAHLYDRVGSPLFGAFTFSWTVCNYRLLVILLSDGSARDKFKHIDEIYSGFRGFPPSLDWAQLPALWVTGFLLPLSLTLLIIFIYPWPALGVYRFSLFMQNKLSTAKTKFQNKKLLGERDAQKLRQSIAHLKFRYDRDLGEANATIEKLSVKIARLEHPVPAPTGLSLVYDDSARDGIIVESLDKLTDGSEFQVSELFTTDSWRVFNAEQKSIEDLFMTRVENGEYPGVGYYRDGVNGQRIYRIKKIVGEGHSFSLKQELLQLMSDSAGSSRDLNSIVAHLDIPAESVSRGIKTLVEQGEIEKRYDPDDGHEVFLLSDKGKTHINDIRKE